VLICFKFLGKGLLSYEDVAVDGIALISSFLLIYIYILFGVMVCGCLGLNGQMQLSVLCPGFFHVAQYFGCGTILDEMQGWCLPHLKQMDLLGEICSACSSGTSRATAPGPKCRGGPAAQWDEIENTGTKSQNSNFKNNKRWLLVEETL